MTLKRITQPVAQLNAIRVISVGSFRRRLTLAEKVAIQESADPVIKVITKDLETSSYVDLDFDDTVKGLNYLVQAGVLTAERLPDILADGTAKERPVIQER